MEPEGCEMREVSTSWQHTKGIYLMWVPPVFGFGEEDANLALLLCQKP
jgi:hypothetical protein